MSRQHEGDFAHSLTDLMAGVAVTFLLIAAIFMVQAAKAKLRADAAQEKALKLAARNQHDAEELEQLRVVDRASIEQLSTLAKQLSEDKLSLSIETVYRPDIDPRLLTIVFRREALRFGSGECSVDAAQLHALEDLLGHLFPPICDLAERTHALQQQRSIDIALEGHTDSEPPLTSRCGVHAMPAQCSSKRLWSDPACLQAAFENNVKLSSERAQSVFFAARSMFAGNSAIARCLDRYFVASGRGPVEPLDGQRWDMQRDKDENERNRRVVIKVRVAAAAVRQARP